MRGLGDGLKTILGYISYGFAGVCQCSDTYMRMRAAAPMPFSVAVLRIWLKSFGEEAYRHAIGEILRKPHLYRPQFIQEFGEVVTIPESSFFLIVFETGDVTFC